MTPLSRALAGALLVVSLLGGSLALTAGPAAASDSVGLTYDQWRTGRLVLGVLGLAFLGFFVFRALRARWSQRRTTDDR
ncbi:hypothetical protein [Nocardioides terrigena]|uniref:hypothetical protein n=1 Tax=Nocardioides terrigena TaxID=424797 RepID=UPI000D3048C1|nr:hypothetical protein [Nocardioides terrigena]